MKNAVRLIVIMALLVSGSVLAQKKYSPNSTAKAVETLVPALNTEQKQALQIQAQRIEIAQLKAQAAQAEFDKARTEIATLVQSLQRDGFDLDLQTLTYTPKKSEKK